MANKVERTRPTSVVQASCQRGSQTDWRPGVNRRSFLQQSAGLAAAPFLACLSGCDAPVREQSDADYINGGAVAGRLGGRRVDILRLASLAPSGYNAQPWTVTIEDRDLWRIGSAPDRLLPLVDPENLNTLLSLGAFLENLIEAADTRGFRADYEVIARRATDTDVLRVRLRPAAPTQASTAAIRKRRTLRSGYRRQEIAADDLDHLTRGLGGLEYFPVGTSKAAFLAEGAIEAERAQLARQPAREQIADWIRWSGQEARRHANGLTPACLEMDAMEGWLARTFYDREDTLSDSFRNSIVDRLAERVCNCGGWVALTAGDRGVPALIEAGRAFERFFLRLRERRIAVQPISSILVEQPWKDRVAAELGQGRQVLLVLRIGYVDRYPEPVSLRMPLSSFVRF